MVNRGLLGKGRGSTPDRQQGGQGQNQARVHRGSLLSTGIPSLGRVPGATRMPAVKLSEFPQSVSIPGRSPEFPLVPLPSLSTRKRARSLARPSLGLFLPFSAKPYT